MKKRTLLSTFIIIILAITINGNLLAEENIHNNDACIWKIVSDNNTLYLMGSIHFLQQSDYPLDEKYYRCFEDAENVVFELHYDSTQTPAFQQYTVLKAFCPKGETFQSMVSDSTYDITRKALLDFGTPLAQLQQFEPWFLAITMLSLKLQSLGFNPELGVDQHFFNRSKEEEKNILAFETPEQQMDLLESLGGDDQESFLLKTIDELDEMEAGFSDLVDAWKAGDLEELNELLNKGFEDYPALKQSLLIQRNLNWIDEIEGFTKDNENYLIIVGAGHLAGNKGLVNLLTEKGYSVEQIQAMHEENNER